MCSPLKKHLPRHLMCPRSSSLRSFKDPSLFQSPGFKCEPCPVVHPSPVCGTDGHTYSTKVLVQTCRTDTHAHTRKDTHTQRHTHANTEHSEMHALSQNNDMDRHFGKNKRAMNTAWLSLPAIVEGVDVAEHDLFPMRLWRSPLTLGNSREWRIPFNGAVGEIYEVLFEWNLKRMAKLSLSY